MPRKLIIAGIVITGIGLALLAYLDPVIRILLFGQTGPLGGGTSSVRTGPFVGNFTGGSAALVGPGARGAAPVASVATILVFVATVIGLLLTIAGTFASEKSLPTAGGTRQRSRRASRGARPSLTLRGCPPNNY